MTRPVLQVYVAAIRSPDDRFGDMRAKAFVVLRERALEVRAFAVPQTVAASLVAGDQLSLNVVPEHGPFRHVQNGLTRRHRRGIGR
jgi:hypothetical protein